MTIEFPCPQCAQLVRTPDAAAGKRGKCPSCLAVVQIPAASRPVTTKPPVPAKPTAPAKPAAPTHSQPPPSTDTGPIEFFCASCGQQVRTPRAAAGKKGKCPHCASVVQIPLTNKPVSARQLEPEIGMAADSEAPAPAELTLIPKTEKIATAKRTKSAEFTPAKPAETKQAPAVEIPAPVALQPTVVLAVPPPQPPTTISPKPAPILAPHPKLEPLPPENAGLEPNDLDPFNGPTALPPSTPIDTFTNLPVLTPIGHDAYGGAATLGIPPTSYGLPPASSFAPNPYQAPQAYAPSPGFPQRSEPDGAMRILPAVFQLIALVLPLVWNLLNTIGWVFGVVAVGANSANRPPSVDANQAMGFAVGILLVHVILLILHITILVGSINMIQRKGYGSALAAAWLSVIPCVALCTVPFGIWSLVVLYQENVKRSFRS